MRVATRIAVVSLLGVALLTSPAMAMPLPEAGAASIGVSTDDRRDREVALNRPSRGSHTRIIQQAATIPAKWRSWAACVIRRESGGDIDRIQSGVGARNPNSSASGRFQFLDNSWRRGLSFMVRDRLVDFGMPKDQARKVRLHLAERPIWQWHGYWQQIGFNEVVKRGGSFHWRGPGC